MSEYIETPAPEKTNKKGTKKMSDKKLFELPAESTPKTIKLNIRVKTLVITAVLLASHGLVFWAGMKAPSMYDSYVDGLVKSRTAQAQPVPEAAPAAEAAPLKANQ